MWLMPAHLKSAAQAEFTQLLEDLLRLFVLKYG